MEAGILSFKYREKFLSLKLLGTYWDFTERASTVFSKMSHFPLRSLTFWVHWLKFRIRTFAALPYFIPTGVSHNLSCFEWASIISEMTSSRPIHQCFWAWKRALGHVITSKSAQRDIFILFISWIFIQRYFSETMGLGKEENKDSESRKAKNTFYLYFFILKIYLGKPEF